MCIMRKKYVVLVLIILSLILVGCGAVVNKDTKGDNHVINVKSEDEEMNLIIEDSRKTTGEFLKELNNPNTTAVDFGIKYPFDTDLGSKCSVEHIWLSDIYKNNNKYYGIVVNNPIYIKGLKFGDKVEFDINKISDWKYVDNGFLVGGKSIIYFYDHMSKEEKENFEKEAGFKIGIK